MFSDVEGSTRLLHLLGAEYATVLSEKRRLFRSCIDEGGGIEVDTQGDSFFVAFADAFQAVDTAVKIQRVLWARAWPGGVAVRVRMGLHTGRPVPTAEGYVGMELHEGARICAAAHGGQVLLSDATRRAIGDRDATWTLKTLGRFRLKDIPAPELLHQVVASELVADFPPPRTIDARATNLPAETTEFVGRRPELAQVADAIRRSRLVTVHGPGGAGKTRLSIRVAKDLLGDFADGVFLVRLDVLREAAQVPAAVAQALGVAESGDGTLVDRIIAFLRDRQLLLVLDNFEHVTRAAALVVELLTGAPRVRILITSQVVLRCAEETVLPLGPLAVPMPGTSAKEVLAADSVQLFVHRARAADPSFAATPEEVADIAAIVIRLEGMPLAIELAAARVRMFPPANLLRRLGDRFAALTGGPESDPRRHRTLTDLVGWSYGLLDSSEQALLRRLSVFRGGFTVEAAQSVAGADPVIDVLGGIESLLDKSFLKRVPEAADLRFSMSDTIREFGAGRLESADEAAPLRRRHALHFLAVVTDAEPAFTRAGQLAIQARLSEDEHNLRAALAELARVDPPDLAFTFAGAVWRFWHAMGQLDEGRKTVENLLGRPGGAPTARGRGFLALGGLAYWQADYTAAMGAYREALAIFRETGPADLVAETLFAISTTCTWSGHAEEGEKWADQALAEFRALGLRDGIGRVLMAHGFARWMKGDLAGARPLWEESLAIVRETGDYIEAATKEIALAAIRFQQGERSTPIQMVVGALEELVRRHNISHVVMALDFASALLAEADAETACRLAGVAEEQRKALGGGMRPESCGLESGPTVAERRLSARPAAAAFAEGRTLPVAVAVRLARDAADRVAPP
jgi:predicted ATPase/class 3 adenylate cyclase